MGSAGRKRPKQLGRKLKAIRDRFNYSFAEMAEQLSDQDVLVLRTDVSRFEKGEREPNLIILLRYARLAGTTMEVLVDDKLIMQL